MTAAPSNLALRLATAAVMVPIILGLLFYAPSWAFYVLVLPISLVGLSELLLMTHPHDAVARWIGLGIAAVASLAVYFHGDDPRVLFTVIAVVPLSGPLVTLARIGDIDTAALRSCALGFGPLFVVIPLTLLALMRRTLGDVGAGAVLLTLGIAWFADTTAYFAGRYLGRHKLYEAVSPKKTVEGAIGGLLGSVVFAVVASLWFLRGALPIGHAVALALVGGILGQAGDLCESLIKRSMGLKDSGGIVPGHGGVLDRVDALIFASVVVFLYVQWIGLALPQRAS
jgi:phosphatidate cytidylyltransferase